MSLLKSIPAATICMLLWPAIVHAQTGKNDAGLMKRFQQLTDRLTVAERKSDTKSYMAFYEKDAISMPEFQPTLRGISELQVYYKNIFSRQQISLYEKKLEEAIVLDNNTTAVTGTFKKEYRATASDTIQTLEGKFCQVWRLQTDGSYKVSGEITGFFHHVAAPEQLFVSMQLQNGQQPLYTEEEIPLELRAYNALMAKYVNDGEGALRSRFFTDDGRFMPFEHATVYGKKNLKEYLVAYDTRPAAFHFDTLKVFTYEFIYFDDYVLEYPKFRVKWRMNDQSGRVEGKGIRIWKRQKDHSLRIYIELSSHNYIPAQ